MDFSSQGSLNPVTPGKQVQKRSLIHVSSSRGEAAGVTELDSDGVSAGFRTVFSSRGIKIQLQDVGSIESAAAGALDPVTPGKPVPKWSMIPVSNSRGEANGLDSVGVSTRFRTQGLQNQLLDVGSSESAAAGALDPVTPGKPIPKRSMIPPSNSRGEANGANCFDSVGGSTLFCTRGLQNQLQVVGSSKSASAGALNPVTPAKPVPKRSLNPVPSSRVEPAGPNGLDSVGVSDGFLTTFSSRGPKNQLQDIGSSESAAAGASTGQACYPDAEPCQPAVRDSMQRWIQTMPYGKLQEVGCSESAEAGASTGQACYPDAEPCQPAVRDPVQRWILTMPYGKLQEVGRSESSAAGASSCQASYPNAKPRPLQDVASSESAAVGPSTGQAFYPVAEPHPPAVSDPVQKWIQMMPYRNLQEVGSSESAVAGASSGQACYPNAKPRPPTVSNPTQSWTKTMPYRNFLGVADAAATSRMISFTECMFAQMRSCQKILGATNERLHDGNFFLPTGGNNPHLHQNQYLTDDFPIPILPNLNSLPEEMLSTGNMQGKHIGMSQHVHGEYVELSSSNPMMPSQIDSSKQHEGEKNISMPFETTSVQHPEIEEHRKRDNQGIDLNKTPQPKPRRKKHRPKVIREGKPSRTLKPVTPKPVKPEPARNKGSPSVKRKYVRKEKVLNSDVPTDPLREIIDLESESGSKAVKRRLNFDSEEAQARDGRHGSPLMFACNEGQAQDACVSGTIPTSSVKSSLTSTQGRGVAVDNSSARMTFDLNSLMNQMPDEYIRTPETQIPPSQSSRRRAIIKKSKPRGNIRSVRNPPPQSSRRELIQENLKELSRKNDPPKDAGNSDRSLEGLQNNQFHSNNTSEMPLRGTKRDYNLVGEDCISRYTSFTRANDGMDLIGETNGRISHGSYFPKIHKKKRTEKGLIERKSDSSPVTHMASHNWKMSRIVPSSCLVFTFADAQRLLALDKPRPSEPESMLLFDQRETNTNKPSRVPAQTNNLTPPRVSKDWNSLSAPLKPSGFSNTECNQLSTPEKAQESRMFGPQFNYVKPKTKKRTKKEQIHLFKSVYSHTNQICLQERENASCSSSHGQKYFPIAAASSENSKEKNSNLRVSYLQDSQISGIIKKPRRGRPPSSVRVPYEDPVDNIVRKMKCLNIIGGPEIVTEETQNALIPYHGGGDMMVPYVGQFDLTKKRKPRPKVDLDPESNRVWKLLMGKESNDEGVNVDKEKWWEEERQIFRGRVDSFIARMHLVQGDRRFSRWKGSVVDSVVGVFLTQNVSDHLSSSAFMALTARFPPRPKENNTTSSAEMSSRSASQQDVCNIDSDVDSKCLEKMLDQDISYLGSLVIPEAEHVAEKEMANSNESLGSNTGEVVSNYSQGKGLEIHVRELEIGFQSPDSRSSTPVTVTGSTSAAEGEDRSIEDVVSSQNSVVSSQNSCLLPSFDIEDSVYGGMCSGLDNSTSFMELLKMAESTSFKKLYSHDNERIASTDYCCTLDQMTPLEVSKRTSGEVQVNNIRGECTSIYRFNPNSRDIEHDFMGVSCPPSMSYDFHSSINSKMMSMENIDAIREEICLHLPSTASGINTTNNDVLGSRCTPSSESSTEDMCQQKLFTSRTAAAFDTCGPLSMHSAQPLTCSEKGICNDKHSCLNSSLLKQKSEGSSCKSTPHESSHLQDEQTLKFQQKENGVEFQVESTENAVKAQCQIRNSRIHLSSLNSHNDSRETFKVVEALESSLKGDVHISQKRSAATENHASKSKKEKAETEKKDYDWDSLRKQACQSGTKMKRSSDMMDSLDYEAVRCADVSEVSEAIRERGMNNMLSARIKDFLNRLVKDHGSIDLEWLRDVPPDKAKDYLLSIRGLGLKSVECVRLLTLHHLAFPVDTNVGRIAVRLGWVPLQPLPESLQLHLLEMYPVLETIQKYLWPRLCKLDQRTLYELHYQMITFGKVFCTKRQPNCNACPMRAECKHFASAFASARLALPGQEEKVLVSSTIPITSGTTPVCNQMGVPQLEGNTLSREGNACNYCQPTRPIIEHTPVCNQMDVPQLEAIAFSRGGNAGNNCQPIIEEPASPEPEPVEISRSEIEDDFCQDPDEIPHIKLNLEAFTQNIQDYMQANNLELQDGDMSNAVVVLTREAASIPMPKLKNMSRLRTEHQVYELPDSHPLLKELDQRELDDPSPYLLAIWSPGETAQSTEPPKIYCNSQETGQLCDNNTCFACNSVREARAQTVRGTLLIPCRTANRGSFPLNGTYFQVNEMFADHDSSLNPIVVPRQWIWNLPRRTVYFGTSVPTIFRGLTTEGIQYCFWKGFVCVRGFDRTTRAPKPLYARLHLAASRVIRNKKAEAEATAAAAAARKD